MKTIDKTGLKEYNYTYDEGSLVRAVEYDITMTGDIVVSKTRVVAISYVYNDEGELLKKRAIFADGSESSIIPARNAADNTNSSQFYSNASGTADFVTSSETDGLGRKTKDYFVTTSGRIERSFTYHNGEVTPEHVRYDKVKSGATTELVDKITYSDGRTTEYEYDAEERITKVTDSIDGITEYTYDSLGQLLTEKRNGVVINSMTYDGYGNIKSKNGSIYTYGNSTWKDLLTYCKGKPITYDAQGNPTSYMGKTLVWEKGRQLKSYGTNSYTYNANGIRTSKTVNGVKHTYVLDGTKVLKETWDTNTLVPLYDNENSVCGISFNGNAYYFIKNLQGDIIALAAANKTIVARYTYDAWGVCTVTDANGNENTISSFIGNVNPYRYRGYYYDVESGLYYLQSRYYNPSVGRFINGDDTDVIQIDTNLFAYANNDSINNYDPFGYFSLPRGLISMPLDVLFMALSPYLAPIKSFAKKFSGMALKSKISSPLISLIKSVANIAKKLLTAIKDIIKKIPFVGKKWAKKINPTKLSNKIAGATSSFVFNFILDKIVPNITIFLSVGGFIAGFLDLLTDKKLNNKITFPPTW